MRILYVLLLAFFSFGLSAQGLLVGDGKPFPSEPEDGAELEVYSVDKGVLLPSYATADIANIANPTDGLLIYDTDLNQYKYYMAGTWIAFPAQYVAEIVDAQPDTKLQVEKSVGSNDDKVYFTFGASDVAQLNENGFNLVAGKKYLIGGNQAFFQNGTNTVVGNGAQTLSGADNTIVGVGAGAGLGTSDKNTFVGANAGAASTGTANVAIGSGAFSGISSADSSVIVGVNSGGAITSGKNNIIVGGTSGTSLATGARNVIVGNGSGNTIVSGSNNIVIGNGSDVGNVSNALSIGDVIMSDDMTSGVINFHKEYYFPATTNGDDKTLVLQPDGHTLDWQATSSTNSLDISGAAADLQSFDVGNLSNVQQDGVNHLFLVKMTAYSNAEITHLTHRLQANGSGTVTMSVYNSSGVQIGTGSAASVPSGYNDVVLSPVAPATEILVETGKDYYLAVSISVFGASYSKSWTDGIAEAYYVADGNTCPHPTSFDPTVPFFTNCGGGDLTRVSTPSVIWIRAY